LANESSLELREASAALHEELARLPEKYRAPIVLCYLQGHTHETAALTLGWPLGTVRGRLARARDRLRVRMAARGAAPAFLVPGGWPNRQLVRVFLPAALSDAAVSAASRMVMERTATLVRLAGFKAVWSRVLGAKVPRIAALLMLTGGITAAGLAVRNRAPVLDAKADSGTTSTAAFGPRDPDPRRSVDDLPLELLPRWVSEAVWRLQPRTTIVRAIRESDTAYLVDIRGSGHEQSLRVTGRFAGPRKTFLVRRVHERNLGG
jgi:hypothetical protein